jgi:hypothetical protein
MLASRGPLWNCCGPSPPTTTAATQGSLRRPLQVLAARGLQRLQLWRGAAAYDLRLRGATTAGAAAYLGRTYLVDFALGLSTVCWYAYDDWEGEGLALAVGANQNDPSRLSEAGSAYRTLQAWLLGARLAALEGRGDGVWIAQLRRPAGSAAAVPGLASRVAAAPPPPPRSWVLWSVAGQVALEVPQAWNISYWQDLVSGNVTYWQQLADTSAAADNAVLRQKNGTLEALLGPMPVLLA